MVCLHFDCDTGTSVRGYRGVSQYANKELKALLHMGAVSAITHPGELKDYHQRKVAEGKPKMLVLNNVPGKMLARLCVCTSRGEVYQKAYERNAGA